MSWDPVVLVTSLGEAAGAGAAAAALACGGPRPDRAGLLIELGGEPRRPSPIATAAARELEERLAAHLPRVAIASHGSLCRLALPADEEGLGQIAAALPLARGSVAVLHSPPSLLQSILAEPRLRPSAALLRADLHRDRSLAALVCGDLVGRGLRVAVLKQPPGWLPARLAPMGVPFPAGAAVPTRLADRLLRERGGSYAAR